MATTVDGKKSAPPWDIYIYIYINLVNNGMNYQPQLVQQQWVLVREVAFAPQLHQVQEADFEALLYLNLRRLSSSRPQMQAQERKNKHVAGKNLKEKNMEEFQCCKKQHISTSSLYYESSNDKKNILLFWGEDLQKSRVLVALTASKGENSHGSVHFFAWAAHWISTAVNIHVINYLSLDHFKKKSAALSSTRCPFDSVPAVRLWDGGHVSQQLWKQSLSATFRGHWANTLAGCTRSQPARITGRKILWLFEREVVTLPLIIMKSWK